MNTEPSVKFTTALDAWLLAMNAKKLEYVKTHYPDAASIPGYIENEKFVAKIGKRYAKIVVNGSARAFIDIETGDIYKSASWSQPAKGIRGNLFDASNGLGCMTEYGPAYAR